MKKSILSICTVLFLFNIQAKDYTVMFYNILWYNQDTDRDTSYLEILHYSKPDILVVTELATLADDKQFYSNVILKFDSTFSKGEFHPSGNGKKGCDVNIYFDSDFFTLVSQEFITSSPRDHAVYQLIENQTGDTLNVIGSHLKASSGKKEKLARKESIVHLTKFINTADLKRNLIFGGDLNLYTNKEPAYKELIDSGLLIDPLEAGKWHDNPNYSAIHTQSTRKEGFGGGGLDDRFDFIMFSPDMLSSTNSVQYIENSCTDVGNDGEDLNLAITNGTNTEVSQSIIEALFKASDHLPVVLKISIN